MKFDCKMPERPPSPTLHGNPKYQHNGRSAFLTAYQEFRNKVFGGEKLTAKEQMLLHIILDEFEERAHDHDDDTIEKHGTRGYEIVCHFLPHE